MRQMIYLLTLMAFVVAASANQSAAPMSGEALVEAKGCVACHGKDGNGVVLPATGKPDPLYPVLAGQYASYLEYSLKSYRTGTRKNAVMAGFAGASAAGLVLGPALWWRLSGGRAGALSISPSLAVRWAGAALALASAWALGHGLWMRVAAWCLS